MTRSRRFPGFSPTNAMMRLLSLLWLSYAPALVQAKTCLMMYQMADNNLEVYIRQDYEELSQSPVVQDPDLRTWIYYDALNQVALPLPDTLDQNGNPVTDTFAGSRYITYDQSLGTMKIVKEPILEQNSDGSDTIQDFLDTAMTDCLSNGFDSLMVVFSSHGGGFAGFGGDENIRQRRNLQVQRYRKLLQTNQAIAGAIAGALASASGGSITQLDVLGFDACLMQALGAADDYLDITKYILASEAVEPGHGWAYNFLKTAPSALVLAEQVVDTFLSETQGGRSHKTPKTLAILEITKFLAFVDKLETFSAELLSTLQNEDASLHAYVSRSRASAVAFEGILDSSGTNKPSGLDIGSWMEKLEVLCAPSTTETLGSALQSARTAYADMFVEEGVGPGTAKGTGMHLDWPVQSEYQANKAVWNQILFTNDDYATKLTPNFYEFLQWFLSSSIPVGATGDSVCGKRAETTTTDPGGDTTTLFLIDTGSPNAQTGYFDLSATISLQTSEVTVEYGIDLTTPLREELIKLDFTPKDEDYLFLLGGDVAGVYERDAFSARWDQFFYFLSITGGSAYEALYVTDGGDGSRTVPVMFFPEDKKEDLAKLQYLDYLFFDFDFWIEQGANYGFLKFSVDEAEGRSNDNLGLFVSNSRGVFTERPREAGGLLLPLIYLDAFVQDRRLTVLPGGFNQTVIAWSTELDYNILTTPVKNIFDVIPDADAVVVAMTAFNYGDETAEPEEKYYEITAEEAASLTQITFAPVATDDGSTNNLNATDDGPPDAVVLDGNETADESNIFDHGETDGLITADSDEMATNPPTPAATTAAPVTAIPSTAAPPTPPPSAACSWNGLSLFILAVPLLITLAKLELW